MSALNLQQNPSLAGKIIKLINIAGFINQRFDIDDSFKSLSKDRWFILDNAHENNLSQVDSECYCPDKGRHKYMSQRTVMPF